MRGRVDFDATGCSEEVPMMLKIELPLEGSAEEPLPPWIIAGRATGSGIAAVARWCVRKLSSTGRDGSNVGS
ncbi:hypothetical protein BOTBODRAFT_29631 [Botryobasidium botryosum FD-172 SS1]|uniref:Uncharacterized protein n=1 Tax=Botryobasidium botryosum (strain FD-172 SS1) TaxID=930990 RepID=A0A067MRR6_BOTB1|nr:hypothetical protein BOTBODRAFT_29631 [Botryobasidium botryosum FD-172 SS1]